MTDTEFWSIVHDDKVFRAHFHRRSHPLLESNGVAFHRPEALRECLRQAQHDFETMPKVGMSAWARKNRVDVLRDLLEQVEWLAAHAEDIGRTPRAAG